MRSGTANDLATRTSAGWSEGCSPGKCSRDEDRGCVTSYVGDEVSGVGLE